MTRAEAHLWSYLKRSRLRGRKFRRQHSVAHYILDFYCPDERLAIELDGGVHDSDSARRGDRLRDDFLQNAGIRVLRFQNDEVMCNLDWVLSEIRKHLTTTSLTLDPS